MNVQGVSSPQQTAQLIQLSVAGQSLRQTSGESIVDVRAISQARATVSAYESFSTYA